MKYSDIQNPTVEITSQNYENIFNVYLDKDTMYYFNLLKKVDFPSDLDSTVFDYYQTTPKDTYPLISYNAYNSVVLWWLICAANQIDVPTKQPEVGTILKIIKPVYVKQVLSKLSLGDI